MWITIRLNDSPRPAAALSMRFAGAIVVAETIHHLIHREEQSHG